MRSVQFGVLQTFLDFLKRPAREKVMYGGAGSGKTYSCQQYAILKGLQEPNEQTLVVMETRPANLTSMFYPMCQMLSSNRIPYRSKETTPMRIVLPSSNHTIWFTSVDKDEKMKYWDRISRIIINEATALTADDFQQLMNRVGRTTAAENIFTFNPIDENHWLCQQYVLPHLERKLPPNVIVHHSTYHDNSFLTKEWIEWLESRIRLDPNFYRVYALGLPGHLEGLVYQEGANWTHQPLSEFPKDVFERAPNVIGMDWGVADPSVAQAVWDTPDKRYTHTLFYSPGMTPTDVDARLLRVFEQSGWTKEIGLYGDPAGLAYITDMKRRSWNMREAEHSVLYGIARVKDKPIVVSDESVDIIKEFRNYRWKEKDGAFKDEPVKNLDHALDALRYAVCSLGKVEAQMIGKFGSWTGF